MWSLVHRERSQDTTTQAKAMEACTHMHHVSLNWVQSVAYQKQATQKCTFDKWVEEWHAKCRKCYSKDLFAYEYAPHQAPKWTQPPPLESSG